MAQATSPRSSGKNVINLKEWVKRFGDSARKYNYEPRPPRPDWREQDTEYCLTRVELAITEAKKQREDDHQ